MRFSLLVSLCITSLALGASSSTASVSGSSSNAASSSAQADLALHESLAELNPFLGTWEIHGTWSSGQKMWSKSVFTPILSGRFLEITSLVRDGDGEPYMRYHSMVGVSSKPGHFNATSFQFDGTQSVLEYRLTEPGHLEWQWAMGEATIRESYRAISSERVRWQVFMRPGEDAEWSSMMDGEWKKMSPQATPIDTSQFVGEGQDVRRFEKARLIAAPVERVFAAFSSREGFLAAYGPERTEMRANIDLAIGGRYEWLFDGETGSNGCQILSYVPNRMISFTWNAPPAQAANREKRTWVVVELEPVDEGTSVRLTHLGFREGAEWDETYEYFQKAWDFVLATLQENLETATPSP